MYAALAPVLSHMLSKLLQNHCFIFVAVQNRWDLYLWHQFSQTFSINTGISPLCQLTNLSKVGGLQPFHSLSGPVFVWSLPLCHAFNFFPICLAYRKNIESCDRKNIERCDRKNIESCETMVLNRLSAVGVVID